MIKDMERAVFKRETIQLKYLPKVEKKNAQDKCKLLLYSKVMYSFVRKVVQTDCKPKANSEAHN